MAESKLFNFSLMILLKRNGDLSSQHDFHESSRSGHVASRIC